MENRRKIESINREILLPEAIIQHIQSFLSGKEAAQTTILSKSWYGAWLTRPNLDFNQRDFGASFYRCGDEHGFWKFAKKTMKRYEELNLKIESLRLCADPSLFADELIVQAMKMGSTDLCFEPLCIVTRFVLPHEVLESENLVRLSVNRCKIDAGTDGKVSCSRLKSLNLRYVYIQGDIIWNIISNCPLIEELSLSDCSSSDRSFVLSPYIDGPMYRYEFRKLKSLLLGNVYLYTSFFHDFSSRFPCLKDLTFQYCFGYKGIKISSLSLECISFEEEKGLRANFDVPRIRKFKFSGSILPSLSFKTASREWESDISIKCKRPSIPWFLRLKKCLTNLSPSKISLSLNIRDIVERNFDQVGETQGLPKLQVENLTIQVPYSVCSTLLECLFWICRPKFISQYWSTIDEIDWEMNSNRLDALCKTLMQKVCRNFCNSKRSIFGECDLKEVYVEYPRGTLTELRRLPLPLKTLLDASREPKINEKFASN